jgi:uroporphyrin-III C-methyltransferase
MKTGSLTVVGTGIKAIAHMTGEGVEAIRHADKVLYGTAEPLTENWILRNSKRAESLDRFYSDGETLMSAYEKMIAAILSDVRGGLRVCACFEGHPGVFVYASHESLRILRAEGYRGRMLPGVSTQEALFCDLGIDPGEYGCQSFDATDFLLRGFEPDVTSALILWQLDGTGDYRFWDVPPKNNNLDVLAEVLGGFYGEHHTVLAYQAPMLVISKPAITCSPIAKLAELDLYSATLYVPPLRPPRTNADLARRFGV